MAGKYTVVHRGSDGEVIQQFEGSNSDEAAIHTDDCIDELEGDSGATLTVTWED